MSATIVPSISEFSSAMRKLPIPSAKVLRFLKVHYDAPGRALTATKLAEAAGYENYKGLNLQYGLLAKQIGIKLGQTNDASDWLPLLVVPLKPGEVTNEHWILIMNAEFAGALQEVGWLSRDINS